LRLSKKILFGQPWQRRRRNEFFVYAEGISNLFTAVFGPLVGQKLHDYRLFLPSAELMQEAVQIFFWDSLKKPPTTLLQGENHVQ
jgi:hypothetical protein